MLSISCFSAAALGLLIGYVFAWATRRPEPNGSDVAALLGMILGGTVLNVINQIDCPSKLPLYVLGLAIGYAIYLAILKVSFPVVRHHMERHGLRDVPLFPWLLSRPCTSSCGNACGHNGNP